MICPQCGGAVDQDFGVVTCGSCHSVLSIDLDGNISIANSAVAMDQGLESPSQARYEEISAGFVEEKGFVENETVAVGPQEFETVSNNDFVPESEPENIAGGFGDVIRFSESVDSPGAFSYDLMIREINTAEIKKDLFRRLESRKFQLDVRELAKQIKGGELLLKNLNPVKASALWLALRELPVQISWKQKLY